MKYLRHIGLVSSLVIGGVLGGLIAPLPSEAVTSLKLVIDPGTGDSARTYDITGVKDTSLSATLPAPKNLSGCTPDESTAGYNQCYTIKTSDSTTYDSAANAAGIVRKYKVQIAPTLTARMLVADKIGQDLFTLKGVQFAPVVGDGSTAAKTGWGTIDANTNEQHVLKVIMRNTFDFNPGVVGQYIFALHIGGYFIGGPITSANTFTPYANFLGLDGVGTFKPAGFPGGGPLPILGVAPATTNLTPLSFQASNPVSSVASYSLTQVEAYPTFACNNKVTNNSQCTPDITATQTVTMYGPDTWVLTDGQKNVGGLCRLHLEEMDDDDRRISDTDDLATCKRRTRHVTKQMILETGGVLPSGKVVTGAEPPINAAAGAVMVTVACDAPGTNPPVNPCPCAGPACGTGTIVIKKTLAGYTEFNGFLPIPKNTQTFGFTGTGLNLFHDGGNLLLGSDRFNILTDDQNEVMMPLGTGSRTFSGLGGTGFTGPWTFTETVFPGPFDLDGSCKTGPNCPGGPILDEHWFTKSVTCSSAKNLLPGNTTGPTVWDTPVHGLDSTTVLGLGAAQSGHVKVTAVAPGDTLTCTFENGVFEIEQD